MHRILILGSGGREHALAWKIRQSPRCEALYIAPGNGGTDELGINLHLDIEQWDEIVDAIGSYSIDTLVVGPEAPLVEGIRDALEGHATLRGLRIVGPHRRAAQLEGSKAFAKRFMQKYGIPTAAYRVFHATEEEEAIAWLRQRRGPYVLKADGLAAGKGVLILHTEEEAVEALREMFAGRFGEASKKVVIEEYLQGREFSVFILTDGRGRYTLLPIARDYKRIGEGDTGPNTGGMGTVSPVPFLTEEVLHQVEQRIIRPTVQGLLQEGIFYQGFLFFGLMLTESGPAVVEYNCRLGDPETQVILPRLEEDLLQLFDCLYASDCQLPPVAQASADYATAVIIASAGYPGSYPKGLPIQRELKEGDLVFHAGTTKKGSQLVTSGGRVLACVGCASTLPASIAKAYETVQRIHFEGMYYRKDIGKDLL